jgi:hypothetical protein
MEIPCWGVLGELATAPQPALQTRNPARAGGDTPNPATGLYESPSDSETALAPRTTKYGAQALPCTRLMPENLMLTMD